jgi:hypothetical protein
LNEHGISAPRGGPWRFNMQVLQLIRRIRRLQGEEKPAPRGDPDERRRS